MKLTQGRMIDWGQQLILLIVVCSLFWFFGSNAAENIANLGIKSGFDFLDERAGYDISFNLTNYISDDTYFDAYLAGVSNTVLVSFLSIIFATVLGFIIGVGRVSQNWLVAKMTRAYVEVIRNIPLVVQLIWWYALCLTLPSVRKSINFGDTVFISNRGMVIPDISLNGWGSILFITLIVSILAALSYRSWVKSKAKWVGFYSTIWPRCLAIALFPSLCIIVYLSAIDAISMTTPILKGFNFRHGVTVIPELVALCIAISVYSSSYIAEIVRGCIQSVDKGQYETGHALGFKQAHIMWKLIVPQAVYPMIPQLTSVYLNIIKNSSLGVVIGFMELVSSTGGTTLNNTGQAIECILIVMATYCAFSLVTSLLMNWYNSKMAIGK
ncbi:ABC transporter permease subunit [Vibrio sp.]|nr:ABC transporter permease subunit [Vibrio sp.]